MIRKISFVVEIDKKAFEDADVEGIKELLNLPNFDYEIFEEIASITKRQIEEKIGEL